MKRPLLPPSIATVFLLSLAYWLYLACATSMILRWDAVVFQNLGRLLQNDGLLAYFKTGPNNEPVYPLLIAASMRIEHITGLDFLRIMAVFGVIIMFVTQALTYKILRLLNIRNRVCVLVLAYLALSPALNNAAFSLFSEIAAFPIILGIILTSAGAWKAIKQNKRQPAFVYGASLGILFTLATLLKAVFEGIAPVYLIIFFVTVFLTDKSKKLATLWICLAAAASFTYVPVTGYKWLNLHYNGNFTITDRGPWLLYGNTARRVEPLTIKRFAEALAFVPGEGVCNGLFGTKECDFWSFQKAGEFGVTKQDELRRQHLSSEKINAALISLSAQKAIHRPFQYSLLTLMEGLKMFFWESTKVGFVNYPHWLEKIYDTKIFDNGLRLLTFLVSLIAVVSIWLQTPTLFCHPDRSEGPHLAFLMGLLIFLYILFYSFFPIVTRYALPMASLYLISIGLWINQNAKN